MIKNNQDYQSILILIMVQKDPIENHINFSLDNSERKKCFWIYEICSIDIIPID